MRAIVVRETGEPDVLQLEETDAPEPSDGEVLIVVRAASVNPVDWKYRRGLAEKPLPAILGLDVSGTVESSRADGFAEGDDVFGWAASGGYAELATASASAIAKKPAAVSHEQAASIPVAGITAWQSLFDRGGLTEGQTGVITGAARGGGGGARRPRRVTRDEPFGGAARPRGRPRGERRRARGDLRGAAAERGEARPRAQRVGAHPRQDRVDALARSRAGQSSNWPS